MLYKGGFHASTYKFGAAFQLKKIKNVNHLLLIDKLSGKIESLLCFI